MWFVVSLTNALPPPISKYFDSQGMAASSAAHLPHILRASQPVTAAARQNAACRRVFCALHSCIARPRIRGSLISLSMYLAHNLHQTLVTMLRPLTDSTAKPMSFPTVHFSNVDNWTLYSLYRHRRPWLNSVAAGSGFGFYSSGIWCAIYLVGGATHIGSLQRAVLLIGASDNSLATKSISASGRERERSLASNVMDCMCQALLMYPPDPGNS